MLLHDTLETETLRLVTLWIPRLLCEEACLCTKTLTVLIGSEADLGEDYLVEGHHEDLGGSHTLLTECLGEGLLGGALSKVFQKKTVLLREGTSLHGRFLFGLSRCLSALTARANLFLLLLHQT